MKTMVTRTVLIFLIVAINILLAELAFAAGGDLDWSYNSATLGKQDVRATAFDSVGSSIMVGVDGEGAASNWFVAKLVPDGSALSWPYKSFDLNSDIDVATAVVVDSDDNIIVTGYGHNGSSYDIQTIKYAGSDGSILWQHTYDGVAGGDDIATAIGLDSSNNVYIGGYIQSLSGKDDFIVIKYQVSGPINDAPLWDTPINGSADGNDRLMALAVNGSSLTATGESESATVGDFDLFTHKLNLDGTFVWSNPQVYNDSGNGKGLAVAIDGDGNVLVTGYVDEGTRAMYTAKYAGADGSVLWSKQNPGETIEGGHALVVDSNNDVFVTGTSYTVTTAYDVYTVKYQGANPVSGEPVVLWEDDYNTTNGDHDVGLDLMIDAGGDVFVAAYSNDASDAMDNILTLKYDGGDGAMLWPQILYDLEGLHNRPVAIGLAPSGNILIGGWSDTAINNYDFVALSYDPGAIDPPTDLIATVNSNTEIHLSWIDNSTEDNFVVERRAESEGSFTEIATLAAESTSYNSAGLSTDTRYYYQVKATSATDGSSAWSNTASARTTVISYAAPTWLHSFVGTDAGDDDPYAIATGPDQHPVVTGSSFALAGGYDYLTIKLNRTDAISEQWQARYNDGDNEGDTATSIVVDSQNRVVVTGYSSLYGGGSSNTNDIYTLGYPATGPPETWDDQYNGPAGNDDKSSAVAVATDGSDNTVVVGYGKNVSFDNDIYVIKFDPDGNRLWTAIPYDGGDEDYPTGVAIDASGNVFVAGRSHNGTNDDWFVARYQASDGTRSHVAPLHDFSANGNDYAEAITVDNNGDVFVTGYAFNGSNGDIYTVKYSGADLSIIWQQADDSGGYDHGADIGIDPVDSNVLVSGTSYMGASNHDFRLIRYTSAGSAGSGDEVWNHRVDLSGTDDSVTAMAVDLSGVATLTGTSDDDILSVKIDHNETIVGANVYNGSANDIDYPADLAVNGYGEVFVAGSSMNADAVPNTDYVVFMVDGTILPAPTPLTATQLYAEVSLSWSDNDHDGLGFRLERKLNGCASAEPWESLGTFSAVTTSHIDTPVNDNTSYCYRVQSYSSSDSSRWVELDVTTADAVAPSALTAVLVNDTDIELTWTDNTTDATGYDFHIERCAGASCDFSTSELFVVSAASVTNAGSGVATWTDITACSGQPYRYRVLADKPGLWTSLFSTPTADSGVAPNVPAAPTGLTADRVSETLIDLQWTDNSDSENEFIIERCDGNLAACASGTWNTLGTLITVPDSSLHFSMDEATWNGTPAEVIDRSGENQHGTSLGASTTTYGRFSRGGNFDQVDDLVMTPLAVDQSESSRGATLSAWVKPDDSTGYFYLFDTDNGGNDWGLLHNGTSWMLSTGADSALQDTGIAVDIDSWQHVAASFDPENGVKFFKNGSELWSDPDVDPETATGIGFDDSTASLTIGLVNEQLESLLQLHMDEGSWTNGTNDVVDSSLHASNATSMNGASSIADGKVARAGSFDGSDDYIATTVNIDQSSSSTGATFEAWVYPTLNDTNYRHVISTENGGYDWSIVQRNGLWYIQTGATRYSTGITVSMNQWQHIVAVFDPSSGVQFYKNGGENSFSNANIGYDTNDTNVTIGRYANSAVSNYHYGGRIDEVVIYDRPLTAAEAYRRFMQKSFAGVVDEVAVYTRPLATAEVGALHQHGIARYTDTTVSVDNVYSYRVSANKPGGCASDWLLTESSVLETTTNPPAPDVTISIEDVGRIRLNWITNTTTQDGFKLLRCEGSGCTPSAVLDDTFAANANEFVDTTACVGLTYRYQLLATDAVWGDSEPSEVVDGVIPALPAPSALTVTDISEGHAEFEWTYTNKNAIGFNVGYCDTIGTCVQNSDFTPVTSTGLPEGNQLLLHMDEVTWSNGVADVLDASGNNLHGTSYNGAQSVSAGYYGWSGLFDGLNDHIVTPLNIDQSTASPGATFEAWVLPTLNDTNYRHIISTDNGGYDWAIVQRAGYWHIQTGATRYNTNIPVTLNEWQHITAIFNPSTGVQFYKNGGQGTYSTTNIGFDTIDANVTIGRYASSTVSNYHFAGQVDEVVVYARPLTLTEVQDRYAGTKFRFTAGILTPGSNYTFRVWANAADPCSSVSSSIDYNDVVATTTTSALPPASLVATDAGSTQVNLSWLVETTSETLLRLERCTGTVLSCGSADANFVDFSTDPVTLPAAATNYSDTTVCIESDYTYRVRTERDSAPLWSSSWVYVERPAQTLPAIANLLASGLSESEITVTWDDSTLDESMFVLERCEDTDFSCGTPTLVKNEPASSLNYHFDELAWVNATADVLDDTDGVRNGTSYNGANTVEEGRFGRGGDFGTNNDYILTPLNIDQSAASPGATFQAWVYPTAAANNYWHVISTENGGNDWSIVHYNGLWYIYNGSNIVSTGKTVDLNQWQHVAAVFDPATGVQFYKNGTDIYTTTSIGFDSSDYNVTIGRYASSTSTSYNFIGYIDEVAVSERPLSATEILDSYLQPFHSYLDSGLIPGADYSYRLTAKKDVTVSNPDGCDWAVNATYNTATLAPPSPESFQISDKITTELHLAWIDKSGSETDYQIQRCDDNATNCGFVDANFMALDENLPLDSESFSDLSVCPDSTYTYRVRARRQPLVPDGWDTQWVYLEAATEIVDELSGFNVERISEVRIDVSWDDINNDETGFIVERCAGGSCDFSTKDTFLLSDTAGHVVYADDELVPGQTYRYQVKAYKSASCSGGWETNFVGPLETTVNIVAPNLLSATEMSTDRIKLEWTNNAPTAVGTVVERCNGNPCVDAYMPLATTVIGATSFLDDTVCQNLTYSYRIKSFGEGLSGGAGDCWIRRAKVNFSSFSAESVFEIVVPFDDDMRTDFADLRFFDGTGQRELPYWIMNITDQGLPTAAAHILLESWKNDDVYLYYGNANAVDASRKEAFVVFDDDFSGNLIDTDKWIEIDNTNYITQDNGLQLLDLVASYSWVSAVISNQTFDRADGLEFYAKIEIPADTNGLNYFSLGWERDQTTSASYTLAAHNLYWSNNYFRSYETTLINPTPTQYYERNISYEVRIVAAVDGGAYYYIRGGTYVGWTLILDTTAHASRYTNSLLRVSVHQASQEAVINNVQIRSAVDISAVSLDAEEDIGGSCYSPGYIWSSNYSVEDVWDTTRSAQAPTLDNITVIDDTTVEFTWTNNTDTDAAFDVERCCGGGCSFSYLDTAPAGVTSYLDSSVPPSSNCAYQLYAKKDTGDCSWNVGPSNSLAIDSYAAAPSGLLAVAENSRLIRLVWSDNANDEDGFEIQVKNGSGAYMPTATLGADDELHFDSRNIEPDETYTYRIRSFRRVGSEAPYTYEWSGYAYSNQINTPSWSDGDGTCVP